MNDRYSQVLWSSFFTAVKTASMPLAGATPLMKGMSGFKAKGLLGRSLTPKPGTNRAGFTLHTTPSPAPAPSSISRQFSQAAMPQGNVPTPLTHPAQSTVPSGAGRT